MEVNGTFIRTIRRAKQLSQTQLTKGICPTEVLITVEKENTCESLDSLSAICYRLDLTISDVLEDAQLRETFSLLNIVGKLCAKTRYESALTLMEKHLDLESIDDFQLLSRALYYLGITTLLGKNEKDQAFIYFKRAITLGEFQHLYTILSINGMAACFSFSGEHKRAKTYYEKALMLMEQHVPAECIECADIYYTSAKFYSNQNNYSRAYELCTMGILLTEKNHSTHMLEGLYFERGKNQENGQLRGVYIPQENYLIAEALSAINQNDQLHSQIQTHLNKQKIKTSIE